MQMQGSGQTLDSGGRPWHQKRHFHSTAMFFILKILSCPCFFPTVVVGGVSECWVRPPIMGRTLQMETQVYANADDAELQLQ